MVFEDNRIRRQKIINIVQEAEPYAEVHVFEQTVDALEYVQQARPEVAFISMEPEDGRGYFLVKKLSKMIPKINIIAVAKEYRYAQELMRLRVSGYISGDLTLESAKEELANLRYSQNIYG